MNPFLGALLASVTLIGMWGSWKVGYHLNDWVATIFSYRARVTETHLVIEPRPLTYEKATPAEVEAKREDKILDNLENSLLSQRLYDIDYVEDDRSLYQTVNSMITEQRNALYYLMGAALEEQEKQREESVEIVTYGGNVRHVKTHDRKTQQSFLTHNEIRGMKWGMEPQIPPYDVEDL